jgi:hypothetical protein
MEVINSFFSNIKDKLTNPYFGTLILVLIFHNWELIYTLFNFDKKLTLDEKLTSIKSYISINITFTEFLCNAFLALVLMLSGYLIIVFTRSIVLWVEFWLMPFITGKIINKNVVQKNEFDKVVKEREEYFDQYEEQRKNVRMFSKTIDEQTEQIKQKDKDLIEQSNIISSSVKQLDTTKIKFKLTIDESTRKDEKIKELNSSIKDLQKNYDFKSEKLDKFEHLFFDKENIAFYSSRDQFPTEIINKVDELKKKNKWKRFLQMCNFFENGGSIGSELITEMVKMGLALGRDDLESLTPVGKIIYKYNKVFF